MLGFIVSLQTDEADIPGVCRSRQTTSLVTMVIRTWIIQRCLDAFQKVSRNVVARGMLREYADRAMDLEASMQVRRMVSMDFKATY